MADDFGYINARLRPRRANLLPESFFEEALRLSFGEFYRSLAETPYGGFLSEESVRGVDQAVTLELQKTVGDLLRLASGDAEAALGLILLRGDLQNLKLILRGKAGQQTPEEIEAHLGGGSFSPALLRALLEAPDATAMAGVLTLPGHPLAQALRRAVTGTPDPLGLEVALDRAFFHATQRQAGALGERYLTQYLTLELDTINLSTAFKLQASKTPPPYDGYFIPGGRLVSNNLFNRVAAGENAALAELAGSALASVSEIADPAQAESALRCALLSAAHRGVSDPLGAGLALDYIVRKNWEAARIRLLARQSFYHLPAERVAREVFCP